MPVTLTDFDEGLATLLANAALTHGAATMSRTASCFYHAGVRSVQDISRYGRDDFSQMPNCGRKTIALIDLIAATAGVIFRDSEAPTAPPTSHSLYDRAFERFGAAFQSGTGITLSATEVAAIGSLVLLAAKMRNSGTELVG